MPEDTALIKTALLNDEPIPSDYKEADDGLGFHAYAKILAGAALGTSGPFTIGIFGEWGTGKTSLLQMVKGLLDAQEDEAVVTVWFDAWLHEQDEHPLVPLVATILQALEPHQDLLAKLSDGGKHLLNALLALAQGFSVKVKRPDMQGLDLEVGVSVTDAKEALDKLNEDPALKQSLHAQVLDKLSDLNLRDKLKIVILIDDLDRCMPDRAIKLLETIKLVLSQPGFVFMLGVSRRVIEGYLEHRYEEEYGLVDFKGAAYLDKIVQLPFPIPPHSGRMEDFSASLLARLQPGDAQALEGILPLIGVACGNNPRATVRFVNNLLVDRAISGRLLKMDAIETATEQGQPGVSMLFFAITRALQQRWPDAYHLLTTSEGLCAALAAWDSGKLSEYAESGTEDEKAMAIKLISDGGLREVLLIHGKGWLQQPALREATIQFLETQRQETIEASESARFWIWLLRHSEDVEKVAPIRDVLSVHVDEIHPVDSDVQPHFGAQQATLVWIIGSDWERWQEHGPLIAQLDKIGRNPVFLILLPEAEACSLAKRHFHQSAIQLMEGQPIDDALKPLIASLRAVKDTIRRTAPSAYDLSGNLRAGLSFLQYMRGQTE